MLRFTIILLASLLVTQTAEAGPAVIWGSPYPTVLGKGGIKFKNSDTSTTCNAAAAGSIRYNAGTFEGCDGSAWAALSGGGGGGTPAGSTGEIQYNNAGSFGAESNLFWDAANDRLGIKNSSPQYTLHVITSSAYAFYGKASSGGVFSGWESGDGTPVMVQLGAQNGGNSKIGTTSNDSFGIVTNNQFRLTALATGEIEIPVSLRLKGSSSGYVGFQAPASPTSVTYTLPTADGTSGQVLSTNGSGVLSWATGGGGITWSDPVDSNILPDTQDQYTIGAAGNEFSEIYSTDFYGLNRFALADAQFTQNSQTLPSGGTSAVSVFSTAGLTGSLSLFSSNEASGSLDVKIETGNASGGNSGDIALQTGTASGTRGAIRLNALFVKVPTATADPSGATGGELYFNTSTSKLRLYDGSAWVSLN